MTRLLMSEYKSYMLVTGSQPLTEEEFVNKLEKIYPNDVLFVVLGLVLVG